MVWHRMV